MANKRHKPEEIVQKFRQVEVLVGQGVARVDAIREVRITEQTYYRWRKKYGVPLTHPAGHAQADFGEAVVVIGGVEQKAVRRAFAAALRPRSHLTLCPGSAAQRCPALFMAMLKRVGAYEGNPRELAINLSAISRPGRPA